MRFAIPAPYSGAAFWARLRATLENSAPGIGGDVDAEVSRLTPAAVLFALVDRPEGCQVLLTRRSAHLRDHPGQISFPGGRIEAIDASPVAAALREAEEEIGLSPGRADILGVLPPYATVTGFLIHPIVAKITPPFTLRLDPVEVAEAFEAPLAFLIDPAHQRRERLLYRGKWREYLAIPYAGHHIWGATAGMIQTLGNALSESAILSPAT